MTELKALSSANTSATKVTRRRAKKASASAAAAFNSAIAQTSATGLAVLFQSATPMAWNRSLSEAQPDESDRLEMIRADWIDGTYRLVDIADSKVSAQFLNGQEDVVVENRETILQVSFFDVDLDYVFAAQDGSPLGLIISTEQAELRYTNIIINGYAAIIVKVPESGLFEAYAVDDFGQYTLVTSQPI